MLGLPLPVLLVDIGVSLVAAFCIGYWGGRACYRRYRIWPLLDIPSSSIHKVALPGGFTFALALLYGLTETGSLLGAAAYGVYLFVFVIVARLGVGLARRRHFRHLKRRTPQNKT